MIGQKLGSGILQKIDFPFDLWILKGRKLISIDDSAIAF